MPLGWIKQMQHAMQQREIFVRRDDIDVIWIHRHAVSSFEHRHRGYPLQQLRQATKVAGVKMLDDDKGHAAIARRVAEKGFERLQTAG